MKFGLILPQNTENSSELIAAARASEERGLDSIWVVDNLQERPDPTVPFLESWTSLSAAGAATSRIQIGTMVQRVTIRLPAVAAAMAATLERIAPERVILGLGVADSSSRHEQEAFGIPFDPKGVRFNRLQETVAALRESAPRIPLWLGAESDESIAHAGLFDGWNYWGPSSRFPERARKVRSAAGNKDLELSWSGPWRDFDLGPLAEAGAGHVIIATNAANYRKRIEMVQDLLDEQRKRDAND